MPNDKMQRSIVLIRRVAKAVEEMERSDKLFIADMLLSQLAGDAGEEVITASFRCLRT